MRPDKRTKIKQKNKPKKVRKAKPDKIQAKAKKTPLWSNFDFVEEKTDKFWDKKAFKQCLWQYFIKINKGKLTTENDKDKVWIEFNSIGAYAERKFDIEKKEKPKMDYIKKLYDGLEKRGLKTLTQKHDFVLKKAKINIDNITQAEAQKAIFLILKAETANK